jgi:hypothetical protein
VFCSGSTAAQTLHITVDAGYYRCDSDHGRWLLLPQLDLMSMLIDAYNTRQDITVDYHRRRASVAWLLLFLGLLAVSSVVCLWLIRVGGSPSVIAWILYMAIVTAVFYQPRYGVYVLVGLTMIGDQSLLFWFPFAKNMSSPESLMFLHDSLIMSPLELSIVLTALAWLGRMAMERRIRIYQGSLLWPAVFFLGFVTYGLVWGLLRGGNYVIALWEARAIYYLLAMLFLTSNLIETTKHVNRLLWIIVIALFVKSLFGVWYVVGVLKFDLAGIERIAEHSMSIHFNLVYILAVAAWLFRDSWTKRLVLPLMLPPLVLSYFANHRRASFLTLGVALALGAYIFYREQRRLFWWVMPVLAVFVAVFMAVTWNSGGALGLPASAFKSVIGLADERDQSSNIYRTLENVNSMFTIRSEPLQGVGFGQKFYIIAPMADISFFEWWEYITHNSIMWIWMKTGLGGYLTMLFLIGLSIAIGARTIWNVHQPALQVAAATATLYLVMHFVYAYVDISWEVNSMILVGTMIGLINCLDRIDAVPLPTSDRRWRWQVSLDELRGRPRWPWQERAM